MGEFLLALDVGNTNTVVGLFQGESLKTHWRLTTHAERTADEVGMWLSQLLSWERVDSNFRLIARFCGLWCSMR